MYPQHLLTSEVLFMTNSEEENKTDKDSIICDSVVEIENYLSLALNYIENKEEIEDFNPIYLALEKIQDEVIKIKNIYDYNLQ